MTNNGKHLIQSILNETSKSSRCPFWICILIQIIANLQVTYLILQPSFNPNFNVRLVVFKLVRMIASYTVGVNIYNPPEQQIILDVILYFMFVYLLAVTGLLIYLVVECRMSKTIVHPTLSSITGIVYMLHGKIFFLPIHYMMIWKISRSSECFSVKDLGSSNCKVQYLTISIICCILNFIIGFSKEMIFYKVSGTKDPLALKSNRYFQSMLMHKLIIVIIIIFVSESELGCFVLNLFFSIIYSYILLVNIPFFNALILRVGLIFAAVHLSFSILVFAGLSKAGHRYFEILIAITASFFTKIFLSCLNISLKKISRLGFRTPEEAAHALALVKQYIAKYSTLQCKNDYSEGIMRFHGLLSHCQINPSQFDTLSSHDQNIQLYTIVLLKINDLMKAYPKSEMLTLLIAKTYMKKLKNIAKALVILNRLELSGPSIQALNSISNMYSKLEKVFENVKLTEKLESVKYFEHRDAVNKIKADMQKEISLHTKIWKELSSDKVDAYKVADFSERVDKLYKKIQKSWSIMSKKLDKSFVSPLLLYGFYLELVRKSSYESTHVIKKYYDLRKEKIHAKKSESLFSSDVAIILASVELEKIGTVLDVSSSVHSMFNTDKERFIGRNVNTILPRFIAKKHDGLIRGFSSSNRYDLDKNFESYGRTTDGHYFPLAVSLRVYPHLDRGLNIIARATKLQTKRLILITDQDGVLIDCSEDLFEIFNLTQQDLDYMKLADICPELNHIEKVFNVVYNEEEEEAVIRRRNRVGSNSPIIAGSLNVKLSEGHYRKIGSFKRFLNQSNNDIDKGEEYAQSQTTIQIRHEDSRNFLQLEQLNGSNFLHPNAEVTGKFGANSKTDIAKSFVITKKIAQELVKQYSDEIKLTFYPKRKSPDIKVDEDGIELKVNIKPFIFEGHVYKIIRFKETCTGEGEVTMTHDSNPAYQTSANHHYAELAKNDTNFGERFPTVNERSFSVMKQSMLEKTLVVDGRKEQPKVDRLNFLLCKGSEKETVDETLSRENQIQTFQGRRGSNKNLTKISKGPDDTSSIQQSSNQSTRVVKTLNELYEKRTMRPATRRTVIVVYITIALSILLASLEYFFSQKSFSEMTFASSIVDVASSRIGYSIQVWEFALILYTRSVKLRPLVQTAVTGFQANIRNYTASMLHKNRDLQDILDGANNAQLIERFFKPDMALWIPYSDQTFDSGLVNSITATKVIAQKSMFMGLYPNSVLNLNNSTDVLFLLNNTANDLLVQSQNLVSYTEDYMSKVLSQNETLLTVLLSFEVISLLFIQLSLILVVKVILDSYQRLFRALTKINPNDLIFRAAELSKAQEYLSRNIETKDFSMRVEPYLETFKTYVKLNVKKQSNIRYRENRFFLRRLATRTVRSLLSGFILVMIVMAVFLVSYMSSSSTFTSLGLYKQKLSFLHKLSYSYNMILSTFYYQTLFQNRTDFLISYKSPGVKMDEVLDFFSTANERLISLLADSDGGFSDPFVKTFLKDNFCHLLATNLLPNCIAASVSASGLLGFNSIFYEVTASYLSNYRANPTFDYASQMFVPYTAAIQPILVTAFEVVPLLKNYILNSFLSQIQEQKVKNFVVYVISVALLLCFTVIIQTVIIKQFKEIDLRIKKILKIIPFNVLKENRQFEFYLKNEFKKELSSVNQLA